ncbi:hypothetical protein [Escherichia coli]|uniref:hypothetical protein n=1 Tax=Escherichia coli TaxID=562 RepID=UPI000246EC20|nr:hypothetical protein ESOG_04164 [Escherichia coli E101]
MRILLKGTACMAMVWLVIYFGMELLFIADRIHPALRIVVVPGLLFLVIMVAGGMCRFLFSQRKT